MERRSKTVRKTGSKAAPVAPAVPAPAAETYHPSPEHKTHPGPWGQPKWHRREPELRPCPTDLSMADAQTWLDNALKQPGCWQPGTDAPNWEGRSWPAYLYWFVAGRGFFMCQREQRKPRTVGPFTYKGYPVPAAEVPARVIQALMSAGLMSHEDLKEAEKAGHGKAQGRP